MVQKDGIHHAAQNGILEFLPGSVVWKEAAVGILCQYSTLEEP